MLTKDAILRKMTRALTASTASRLCNFVYPAYVQTFHGLDSTKFDYQGMLTAPIPALLPGGYISASDVNDTIGWPHLAADGLAMRNRVQVAATLADYYRKRANEYDTLYATAAWQSELPILHNCLVGQVRGATVLELAAATGYWTAVAAPVASAVVATDINPRCWQSRHRWWEGRIHAVQTWFSSEVLIAVQFSQRQCATCLPGHAAVREHGKQALPAPARVRK